MKEIDTVLYTTEAAESQRQAEKDKKVSDTEDSPAKFQELLKESKK